MSGGGGWERRLKDGATWEPGADAGADAALEQARKRARAELRARPVARRWTRDAGWMIATLFGVTGLGACWLLWVGGVNALPSRGPAASIALLGVTQLWAAWAAMGPLRWRRIVPAVALGGAAMALVLIERAERDLADTWQGWPCAATHGVAAVLPFLVMLVLLRQSAPNPVRAAVAGMSVGTVGALLGELACVGGWHHALVWHLGTWMLLIVTALLVAPRLRRVTMAP